MTPRQKIKCEIILTLLRAGVSPKFSFGPLDTPEQIEEAYDELDRLDVLQDYESEFRYGEVETNIPAPSSRHYESKSVARKMSDGSWVGWTFWYGGGKHGDPGSIDWMGDAYNLTCVEEEKLVIVRIFTRVE